MLKQHVRYMYSRMRDSNTDVCRNHLQGHIADINLKGRTRIPSYTYSDTETMKWNGTPMSALKRVANWSDEGTGCPEPHKQTVTFNEDFQPNEVEHFTLVKGSLWHSFSEIQDIRNKANPFPKFWNLHCFERHNAM
jgi:hypothetical protein